MPRKKYDGKIKRMSVQECLDAGRHQPLAYDGPLSKCVHCGKPTRWELGGYPLCFKCNDKPEVRDEQGICAIGMEKVSMT